MVVSTAAPSQLVSESDMILGYRGDDAYGGGSGTGGGGGEERDPRSDYMGMKGKTRVGPGPSQQGGPKKPSRNIKSSSYSYYSISTNSKHWFTINSAI